jgi:hypothetical protein
MARGSEGDFFLSCSVHVKVRGNGRLIVFKHERLLEAMLKYDVFDGPRKGSQSELAAGKVRGGQSMGAGGSGKGGATGSSVFFRSL